MIFLLYLFIVLLLGAGLWGAFQNASWGIALSALALLLLAVTTIIRILPDTPSSSEVIKRQGGYGVAAGFGMARHLASTHPESPITVVWEINKNGLIPTEAIANGLIDKLEKEGHEVTQIRIKASKKREDGNFDSPSQEGLSEIYRKVKERITTSSDEVIVLLFPPSEKILRLKKENDDGPDLAVICNMNRKRITALREGVISAAVLSRPDAQVFRNGVLIPPPSNLKKAFAMKYELLTPKSIDEFVSRYPHQYE